MANAPLGLLIAGTCSGCGKTTVTLALLASLARRGYAVQACKVGPDFIDPTYHTSLTGRPSYNLDTWMGGSEGMERVFARALRSSPADLVLVEGVMGLFDGARESGGAGSTAHAARRLRLPVLLVADVRGMAQSAAALAQGYLRHMPELTFAGVVCTHVGGQGHREMLREAFAAAELPLLGLLPRDGAPALASRHLGLLMAYETPLTSPQRNAAADWLERHLDLDALLARLPRLRHGQGEQENSAETPHPHRRKNTSRPRLGIARDEAFCFLYPDIPDALRELGLEPVFFSPLRDEALPPDCAALYFPGGYPELHGAALSGNTSLRSAVRCFSASGGVVYGECGGYMYLMKNIEFQGQHWPMTGCLPLSCRLEEKRSALGYREVTPAGPGVFLPPGAPGLPPSGRGHEYHYARIVPRAASARLCPAPPGCAPLANNFTTFSHNAEAAHEQPDVSAALLNPLWHVRDRNGRSLPDEGVIMNNTAGSWVHLYPEGARALLENFAAVIRNTALISGNTL